MKKTMKAQDAMSVNLVFESLKYSVISDNKDHLTNGDEVKIKATYSESLAKEANVNFTNLEFTYVVEGLKDGVLVDPFAEMQILYDGISPDTTIRVKNRSEKQFIRDITYTSEPSTQLRAGDKIIITAKLDAPTLEKNGFILPDALQKEIVVENIDEYLSNFSDLDAATKDRMKKEGIDITKSKYADKYSEVIDALELFQIGSSKYKDAKFDDPELANIYAAFLKQGEKASIHNKIFYVYKVAAKLPDDSEPRTIYAAVVFDEIIKRGDGQVVVDFSRRQLVAADKELEKVYNAVVLPLVADYEVEDIKV